MCLMFLVEFQGKTDHHFCFVSIRVWNMLEYNIKIYKCYFYYFWFVISSDVLHLDLEHPSMMQLFRLFTLSRISAEPTQPPHAPPMPHPPAASTIATSPTCADWFTAVLCFFFLTAFEFTLVIFSEYFSPSRLSNLIIIWFPEQFSHSVFIHHTIQISWVVFASSFKNH